MKRTKKSLKVFVTFVALSGVAAAMDYQEQPQNNQIIVGNDNGSFEPPKSSTTYLDEFKSWIGRFS
ncbi:hypothetical protein [Colwellia psychrerythraea]|uniref:Uncharacterized protein n=1 Tax=Colwellia psychrerythraea TaxID=28229 RepID=A0A099KHP9_COLPS|nr:hypothetical protein [Colwellia psychrerythraea]KGJ89522.1 hypothetical protein GAB14E_0715 [Colwellia psychrerythraea]